MNEDSGARDCAKSSNQEQILTSRKIGNCSQCARRVKGQNAQHAAHNTLQIVLSGTTHVALTFAKRARKCPCASSAAIECTHGQDVVAKNLTAKTSADGHLVTLVVALQGPGLKSTLSM